MVVLVVLGLLPLRVAVQVPRVVFLGSVLIILRVVEAVLVVSKPSQARWAVVHT